MLLRSIKFQFTLALAIQTLVLIALVFSTLYLLKLRQHDYLILNLSGQLRVISLTLIKQSENYVTYAPRNYHAYNRDLLVFNNNLKKQINDFDKIIYALKKRTIPAELVSYFYNDIADPKQPNSRLEETIRCKWDTQSKNQLLNTIDQWERFKQGLFKALGSNKQAPKLESAAQYIVKNKQSIKTSTSKLSNSFRLMMEAKVRQINTLNKSAIFIIIIISITILVILYFRIFKQIDQTVIGFKRIANGQLDYQVKINVHNEIGDMTLAFNTLTQRIHSLFKITDGINQSNDLDSALVFLLKQFTVFIPIDWLCFAQHEAQHPDYQLSRIHCDFQTLIKEQQRYFIENSFYQQVLEKNKPVTCQDNDSLDSVSQHDPFVSELINNDFKSLLVIPLSYNIGDSSENHAALVFASKIKNAYSKDHLEFLNNITPQISYAVNKTIGIESLVISVIEGLAKLAESRDPETGDHLYRMSQYSKIIAQQLSVEGTYTQYINANYIRAILQFAPMHDIGKVGIGDYILLKPGQLSDEERHTMQQHPTIGAEVLRRCEQQVHSIGNNIFKLGIEIAQSHHEKYDGSGYPNQLSGNDIPLSARIVAVADVFDALTSKRPYKEAWSINKALQVMKHDSGTHFDPDIIHAFEQAMPEILKIYDKHKHI